jgi:hypothetical protein
MGIGDELISAVKRRNMEEAMRLSDLLLTSDQTLDSKDEVSE